MATGGRWLALALVVIFTIGCADPDESIIIGTGKFEGTVSEQTQLASSDLTVRARSGDSATYVIARDGQYKAESAPGGRGPWLLQSDLGNEQHHYGIGYDSTISHVHSYTDLIIRSWFLQQHGISDLDAAFTAEKELPSLPTRQEFLDRAERYLAVVELVLEDYTLTGSDLFNKEFRNDSTGIDLFLNANPVLLEGRSVIFVKTRISDNYQSFLNGDILLEDEGVGTSPRMPENLRVFGNTTGGIDLVWNTPTDSSPVVGYVIERDGEFLANSAYPVYTDSNVQIDTVYNYSVQSLGVSGTRSAASMVSVNSTPGVIETVAPAVPRTLTEIVATTRRVELTWTQDDIDGVVGFNVYRGTSVDDLSILARVTGTAMIDATISSGREYWYAVSALGASGNVSALSEPLRVLTTGIVIEPPPRPLFVVEEFAGLTLPDIDSLNCEATFPVYRVTTNITIEQGCYRVEQDIEVTDFGFLSLEPGVVLVFDLDTGIQVEPTGGMSSVGTNANPVVMTAARSSPGWWTGVQFNRVDNDRNKISHTIIEYGGSGSTGAGIRLVSSENATSVLRVDNSLIRLGANFGISIPGDDASLKSFSGNLVTENRWPAFVYYSSLQAINDGSDFSGNDLDILSVARANIDEDIVIDDPGITMEFSGINQLTQNPARSIIINEGVKIQFGNETAFDVRGNLAIRGTADNPVTLTSKNSLPGSWQGLQILSGANAQLSHVVILNAGQASEQNPAGANLYVDNSRLSLENVNLSFSSSYGFHSSGNGVIVDKAEQVSGDNNELEDVFDPTTL